MISTTSHVCIDADSLKKWLIEALKKEGIEKTVSIIPRPWDAKGESGFFCSIEVEETISVADLIEREVIEHSRGPYIHFYADDVIFAACGAGELSETEDCFFLYYKY